MAEENGRVCLRCGEWKSAEHFYPFKDGINGLYPNCKQCESEKLRIKMAPIYKTKEEKRQQEKLALLALGGQVCNKCGEFKPFSEFSKKDTNFLGYKKQCKQCVNEKYNKPHYQENKEELVIKARLYREENREKVNSLNRERRSKDLEKFRQYDKLQYIKHREKKLLRATQYQREHIDKVIIVQQKRRAQKAKSNGSFTHQEWVELCNKYDNKCIACGESRKLTVDHIIPLSRGGSNDISNIQPLCKSCNSKKHTKTKDYRPESFGILNGMLFYFPE